MTPDVLNFPVDPDPCKETACTIQPDPIVACWKRSCPFTWARQSREDRARREEQDAEMKEATNAVRT